MSSQPRKSTTLKPSKKPKKVKETKERKKATTVIKCSESPTSKPKRAKSETKKVTKEPDRKILVAVDL